MTNIKKPTGDAQLDPLHARALEVKEHLETASATKTLNDRHQADLAPEEPELEAKPEEEQEVLEDDGQGGKEGELEERDGLEEEGGPEEGGLEEGDSGAWGEVEVFGEPEEDGELEEDQALDDGEPEELADEGWKEGPGGDETDEELPEPNRMLAPAVSHSLSWEVEEIPLPPPAAPPVSAPKTPKANLYAHSRPVSSSATKAPGPSSCSAAHKPSRKPGAATPKAAAAKSSSSANANKSPTKAAPSKPNTPKTAGSKHAAPKPATPKSAAPKSAAAKPTLAKPKPKARPKMKPVPVAEDDSSDVEVFPVEPNDRKQKLEEPVDNSRVIRRRDGDTKGTTTTNTPRSQQSGGTNGGSDATAQQILAAIHPGVAKEAADVRQSDTLMNMMFFNTSQRMTSLEQDLAKAREQRQEEWDRRSQAEMLLGQANMMLSIYGLPTFNLSGTQTPIANVAAGANVAPKPLALPLPVSQAAAPPVPVAHHPNMAGQAQWNQGYVPALPHNPQTQWSAPSVDHGHQGFASRPANQPGVNPPMSEAQANPGAFFAPVSPSFAPPNPEQGNQIASGSGMSVADKEML